MWLFYIISKNYHPIKHIHQHRYRFVNIAGQYLQTKDKVGYVVIDLDSGYSELALERLKAIPGTIRCRVLF